MYTIEVIESVKTQTDNNLHVLTCSIDSLKKSIQIINFQTTLVILVQPKDCTVHIIFSPKYCQYKYSIAVHSQLPNN